MKSDIEKRLEYVRSQREILQRTEEELQKQLDAEKPEFDFRSKMPAGSVWLRNLRVSSWGRRSITFVRQNDEEMPATIYHAHQIVKAAQGYAASGGWCSGWVELNRAVEAAEQDGVLQNLE